MLDGKPVYSDMKQIFGGFKPLQISTPSGAERMQDRPLVLPDGFTIPDTGTGNPAAILDETLSGLRRFQVLATACKLGIFSHCTVPMTVDELSGKLLLRPGILLWRTAGEMGDRDQPHDCALPEARDPRTGIYCTP
jgi:hypothetical protein